MAEERFGQVEGDPVEEEDEQRHACENLDQGLEERLLAESVPDYAVRDWGLCGGLVLVATLAHDRVGGMMGVLNVGLEEKAYHDVENDDDNEEDLPRASVELIQRIGEPTQKEIVDDAQWHSGRDGVITEGVREHHEFTRRLDIAQEVSQIQ
jgi:hypothetical protein